MFLFVLLGTGQCFAEASGCSASESRTRFDTFTSVWQDVKSAAEVRTMISNEEDQGR